MHQISFSQLTMIAELVVRKVLLQSAVVLSACSEHISRTAFTDAVISALAALQG